MVVRRGAACQLSCGAAKLSCLRTAWPTVMLSPWSCGSVTGNRRQDTIRLADDGEVKACRRLYARCRYVLPLTFFVVGLVLGVTNLVAAPHPRLVDGRVVSAVDFCIVWHSIGYIEVESWASATSWANRSHSLRSAGYGIALLSVAWIVAMKRNAIRRAKIKSESEIIREYYFK